MVSDIAAFQQQYQAAVIAAGPQANGAFVGNTLAEGTQSTGDQLIGPDYRSPRSVQINAGIQHQFGHGTVLTADYVRNVSTHYLIGLDTNKQGDARFLNVANAQNAISATNAHFGCGTGFGAASIDCSISKGATIVGLRRQRPGFRRDVCTADSPCPICAFPGVNPNVGQNQMLFPIGRSVYNGLLVELKSNLNHPMPGVKRMNLIASYTLSRFDSMVQDQDFVNNAIDFNNPLHFFGPSALDRTHQVSVGGVMDLPVCHASCVRNSLGYGASAYVVPPEHRRAWRHLRHGRDGRWNRRRRKSCRAATSARSAEASSMGTSTSSSPTTTPPQPGS